MACSLWQFGQAADADCSVFGCCWGSLSLGLVKATAHRRYPRKVQSRAVPSRLRRPKPLRRPPRHRPAVSGWQCWILEWHWSPQSHPRSCCRAVQVSLAEIPSWIMLSRGRTGLRSPRLFGRCLPGAGSFHSRPQREAAQSRRAPLPRPCALRRQIPPFASLITQMRHWEWFQGTRSWPRHWRIR